MPADTTAHQASYHQEQVTGLHEFFYRVAERFGLPVVILVLVLWWARNDIVQPLLDAHFQFIRTVVEGQREHARLVEGVGKKLDELIELQR